MNHCGWPSGSRSKPGNAATTGPSGQVRVQEPYDTTELPTEADDVLVVAEDLQSGWLWCRSREGPQGWVPQETVAPHQDPAEHAEGAEGAARAE